MDTHLHPGRKRAHPLVKQHKHQRSLGSDEGDHIASVQSQIPVVARRRNEGLPAHHRRQEGEPMTAISVDCITHGSTCNIIAASAPCFKFVDSNGRRLDPPLDWSHLRSPYRSRKGGIVYPPRRAKHAVRASLPHKAVDTHVQAGVVDEGVFAVHDDLVRSVAELVNP